jgi:arylsulfatase
MADNRPNIIFIITDQQRFDTINALGYSYIDTPNLDRLVNEGVTFNQCHVTAASGAPARASLFTGLYPHTTGILKNADMWRHSWVENLRASGYHCVNIGKMHTWPLDTPLGFHHRAVVENKDRYLEGRYFFDEWDKALRFRGLVKQQRELYRKLPDYRHRMGAFEWKLPADAHPDNFVGDYATWWIDHYPKTQPLFLEIGFPGPHPPYDPVPRFASEYMKRDFSIMDVTKEELAGQPPAYHELREHNAAEQWDHDSVVHLLNPMPQQRHKQRAYYMANVAMIDAKIGQILKALEHRGYLENSVLVFTSDHGDCLTDHGHSQKWTMYDQITRMPMIVWAPGRFEGGRRIDGLCQQMDIGPAFLELAEAEIPDPIEARSLLPVLKGEPWEPREYVFAEQAKDMIFTGNDFMTMVRSQTWKLVHFLDESYGLLHDLRKDPTEIHNLWDDPSASGKKREMLDVLREWRIRSRYETASWTSQWR